MRTVERLLEITAVYRAWQAPFAGRKFAPIYRYNDLRSVRSVLDVGCGPGTNTHHFADVGRYLGLDFNPAYIDYARRRHRRDFRVVDVRAEFPEARAGFDFILLNSLLHHIDLASTREILARLAGLLTEDGHVHILELTMPPQAGVSRALARLDRGKHARPLEEWKELFAEAFEPVLTEPYPLGLPGLPLWEMVYFKGRRRT